MLSNAHIKLLKKIKKGEIIRDERSNKDLDYLCKQGYIELTVYDKPDDYFSKPYLTEKGKARLDIELSNKQKNNITLAIAIVAAIGGYREELHWLLQAIMKLLK